MITLRLDLYTQEFAVQEIIEVDVLCRLLQERKREEERKIIQCCERRYTRQEDVEGESGDGTDGDGKKREGDGERKRRLGKQWERECGNS